MSETLEQLDEDPQEVAERSARAMVEGDHASRALGMTLERVARGEAEMSMVVREDMINGHGTCHGGYIFTLADSTFAFACNSRDKLSVLASAHVYYLKPAVLGDRLTARAREIFQEGRNGVYDVEVVNQAGETIAHFRANSRTIGGQVSTLGGE